MKRALVKVLVIDNQVISPEKIGEIKDLRGEVELTILRDFDGYEELDFSGFQMILINSEFSGDSEVISLTEKILGTRFTGSIFIYSADIVSVFKSFPLK